jgi:hypothetical protein
MWVPEVVEEVERGDLRVGGVRRVPMISRLDGGVVIIAFPCCYVDTIDSPTTIYLDCSLILRLFVTIFWNRRLTSRLELFLEAILKLSTACDSYNSTHHDDYTRSTRTHTRSTSD